MFEEGIILYVSPFYFKNGNANRNKYFIIVKYISDGFVIASLPTKKNKTPSLITKKHGCNNDNERMFNCYAFSPEQSITENGFCFPLPTFIYGADVEDYPLDMLNSLYKVEGVDFDVIGKLTSSEYESIVDCIKQSPSVRRGIKKHL